MSYSSSSSSTATTSTTSASSSDAVSSSSLDEAKRLRSSLGADSVYFDQKLIGLKGNIYSEFNPSQYDVIMANIQSSGVSLQSAKILAYEVLALANYYNDPYDKFLPLIEAGKISVTQDKLEKLNITRPSTNQLNLINSNIDAEINKEQVD